MNTVETPRPLEGRVALVTGASRGIGQATALELAGMGATVVGTATTEQGVDHVAELLDPFDGVPLQLDLRERESFEDRLTAVTKITGSPITVLANVAGIRRDNLASRMTDEELFEVINTNLTGTMALTNLVFGGMQRARHGRIISIGSVVGSTGNALQSNYAAAKAGLIGATKTWAREGGKRGVTANVIEPGFVLTDMTRTLSESVQEGIIGMSVTGRAVEAVEVASLVGYLASDSARSITGQVLRVDGGMVI